METMISRHFSTPETYAAWSKDEEVRYKSTSGGAFTEFAKAIISHGGVVAGARYNDDCLVEHCLIYTCDDIEAIRQSKYMASDSKNIYREVKNKLSEGRLVGYCGSPCQVAGLYSFLGKDYENLITFDFICRGMNSPKAFKSWLAEEEKMKGSKALRVWFKYKDGGWNSSPMRTRVDFKDGDYIVREGEDNLFMYGYLSSNLYIRPACGNCRFKGVPRQGDITLADFWKIEDSLDDDKGTSMLLINSVKGQRLFEETKGKMNVFHRDFKEIFQGNPMFAQSAVVPRDAHSFLVDLDNMSFSDALKKHGSYPGQLKKFALLSRIKRKVKHIFDMVKIDGE